MALEVSAIKGDEPEFAVVANAADLTSSEGPFLLKLPYKIALASVPGAVLRTPISNKREDVYYGQRIVDEIKASLMPCCCLPRGFFMPKEVQNLSTNNVRVCGFRPEGHRHHRGWFEEAYASGLRAYLPDPTRPPMPTGCGLDARNWPSTFSYDFDTQTVKIGDQTKPIGEFVADVFERMRRTLPSLSRDEAHKLFTHLVPSSTALISCIAFDAAASRDHDARRVILELIEAFRPSKANELLKHLSRISSTSCGDDQPSMPHLPTDVLTQRKREKRGSIRHYVLEPSYDLNGCGSAAFFVACGMASLPANLIVVSEQTAKAMSAWMPVDSPFADAYIKTQEFPELRDAKGRYCSEKDATEVYMPLQTGEVVGQHRHPVLLPQNASIVLVANGENGGESVAELLAEGVGNLLVGKFAVLQNDRGQANALHGDFDGDQTKLVRQPWRIQSAMRRTILADMLFRIDLNEPKATEFLLVETSLVVLADLIDWNKPVGAFVASGVVGVQPYMNGRTAITNALTHELPPEQSRAVIGNLFDASPPRKGDVARLLRRLWVAYASNPLNNGDAYRSVIVSEQGFCRLLHRFGKVQPPRFEFGELKQGIGKYYALFHAVEAKGAANPLKDAPSLIAKQTLSTNGLISDYTSMVKNNNYSKRNIGRASNVIRRISHLFQGVHVDQDGAVRIHGFIIGWAPPARTFLREHLRVLATTYMNGTYSGRTVDGPWMDHLFQTIRETIGEPWTFDPRRNEIERDLIEALKDRHPDDALAAAVVNFLHANYTTMVGGELPRVILGALSNGIAQNVLDTNKKTGVQTATATGDAILNVMDSHNPTNVTYTCPTNDSGLARLPIRVKDFAVNVSGEAGAYIFCVNDFAVQLMRGPNHDLEDKIEHHDLLSATKQGDKWLSEFGGSLDDLLQITVLPSDVGDFSASVHAFDDPVLNSASHACETFGVFYALNTLTKQIPATRDGAIQRLFINARLVHGCIDIQNAEPTSLRLLTNRGFSTSARPPVGVERYTDVLPGYRAAQPPRHPVGTMKPAVMPTYDDKMHAEDAAPPTFPTKELPRNSAQIHVPYTLRAVKDGLHVSFDCEGTVAWRALEAIKPKIAGMRLRCSYASIEEDACRSFHRNPEVIGCVIYAITQIPMNAAENRRVELHWPPVPPVRVRHFVPSISVDDYKNTPLLPFTMAGHPPLPIHIAAEPSGHATVNLIKRSFRIDDDTSFVLLAKDCDACERLHDRDGERGFVTLVL